MIHNHLIVRLVEANFPQKYLTAEIAIIAANKQLGDITFLTTFEKFEGS